MTKHDANNKENHSKYKTTKIVTTKQDEKLIPNKNQKTQKIHVLRHRATYLDTTIYELCVNLCRILDTEVEEEEENIDYNKRIMHRR